MPPGSKLASFFGNDEALMVVSQWLEVERFLEKRPLSSLLSLGRGGQKCRRNRAWLSISKRRAGLTICLWSPMLERDPLRIVAV